MGGSRKGEHRGNARKRPDKPPGQTRRAREKRRHHETPGEIMNEAVRKHHGSGRLETAVIERRIMIARVINGPSDDINDITPKEALLLGMRHSLQAISDLKAMLDQLARQPVVGETIAQVTMLEQEIERQYAVMKDFARDVAGYIHPKLQAIAVQADTGANQASILQELMDEIDQRERAKPIPIEHRAKLLGFGGTKPPEE